MAALSAPAEREVPTKGPGIGRHESPESITPCPRRTSGTTCSFRRRHAAAASPPALPQRPAAYPLISSDRFGTEAGVDRQEEDAEDTRARLRWGPFAKIYKENDTSAFSGILIYGKCGRGLVGHRGSKTQVRAYRCPPTALGGCLGKSISAHTVEEVVDEALTAFLANALHSSTTDGPANERLTPLHNQLTDQTRRKEDLVQRWPSGALTDAGLGQEEFFNSWEASTRRSPFYATPSPPPKAPRRNPLTQN
ncbi:zinc ribbon domain-containing protein [Streptomyces sp. NPDC002574]|uniref:zinc ribbon domain-containing protein n=1 Tax=Streptomyces sp. NPDC002574 TaxID=3364652 RepID=UPI00367425A1